jgi:hypothetical protein
MLASIMPGKAFILRQIPKEKAPHEKAPFLSGNPEYLT